MLECPICGGKLYTQNTRTMRDRNDNTTMIKRYRVCREDSYHNMRTVEIPEDWYDELTTPKPIGEWIPVKKRPPDGPGPVFAIWECKYEDKGYLIGVIKYMGLNKKGKPMWFNHKKVTHWMPMPYELPDEWKEKK